MRRSLIRAAAVLSFSPALLQADPLGNLGQLFAVDFFLFCIIGAVLTWGLTFPGVRPLKKLVGVTLGVVLAVALIVCGSSGVPILIVGLGLVALIPASPILGLWSLLWWAIASVVYKRTHAVPPIVLAFAGTLTTIALGSALIWGVFPSECRHLLGISQQ